MTLVLKPGIDQEGIQGLSQTPNLTHNFIFMDIFDINLGPVVQIIVSLTSSLRVISLTVLKDSIYNILIFFAEKMCSSLKATHI